MKKLSVLFLSLGTLVACGGGKDDPPVLLPDSGGGGGGGGGGGDDAGGQVTCLLPASLGAATPTQQQAIFPTPEADAAPDTFLLLADLNQDAAPDLLSVELYAGFGVFTDGFPAAATSIPLTGAEVSYDTCGACILSYPDNNLDAEDPYIATAGTLDLTEVSTTRVAGTLSGVTFTHVNIDFAGETLATTPHPDGCSATLDSVAFDAVPEEFMPQQKPGKIRLTKFRLLPNQ